MELRKRPKLPKLPPRFGSVEYADACDARWDERLVRVGRSSVCDGSGVFATRAVPAGTVMTAYPCVRVGQRRGPRKSKGRVRYDYGFELSDGTILDAHPKLLAQLPKRCRRRIGRAHLVNDAIHREVTGRDNNCDFLEDCNPKRPRLHLVTTRAIRAGEELLAPYSFGYWLGREDMFAQSDPRLSEWLACHNVVRCALPHLDLREYMGVGVGVSENDQHLEYLASCIEGKGCDVCGRGGGCKPRRVEIRKTTDETWSAKWRSVVNVKG